MHYKLVQYKENIYTNFWLVPLLMSGAGLLLAGALLTLDFYLIPQVIKQHLHYFLSMEGAETILSVIAAAVITITSVTFSITVLILSIASNQWGPRLLPNFMRQKATQLILGFLIGTFIYSLVVLQAISASNAYEPTPSPYLASIFGFLLGVTCFFLFIYFIHFVCHAIQIDNILVLLTEDLIGCIKRHLVVEKENIAGIHRLVENPNYEHYAHTTTIATEDWGYIQTIDYEKLKATAVQHAVLIKVLRSTGEFVFTSAPLVMVYHHQPLDKAINNACFAAFQLGPRRSTVQDIEFAFEEMSEIAVRALSPGVNNPYTAIHCVDRMVQGLVVLAQRQLPPKVLADDDGQARVIRRVSSYNDIVRTSFNRFRQQAKFDLSVAIHIVRMLGQLLKTDLPQGLREALREQVQLVYEDTLKREINLADKKDLDYFYQEID